MKYRISGQDVEVEISGETILGRNLCLLDWDDDLTLDCSWRDKGFVVEKFLDHELFSTLYDAISDLVLEGLLKSGSKENLDEFTLERYHDFCTDQKTHLDVIQFLRKRAPIENFPLDFHVFDEKVSDICGKKVSCKSDKQVASGYFFVRLVRPSPFRDNNPPHKDAWLNHLRNGLNLYLPLAGSDENSSLSLVPGSHLWSELDIPRTESGAMVDGNRYTVPSAVMPDGSMNMVRPIVKTGDAMLFSPYLIHGGAINFNSNKTRVSLEMRFWKCQK